MKILINIEKIDSAQTCGRIEIVIFVILAITFTSQQPFSESGQFCSTPFWSEQLKKERQKIRKAIIIN